MSVPLPVIDMSQYAVGQSSYVTLDAAKQAQPSPITQATEQCHLRVFNDSGSHLKVWMDTGDLSEYLPAGGWLTWAIDQTANEFHWSVVNILPNPPVQLMMITWYKQGEDVPQIPTLGNSPIGGVVTSGGPTVVTATNLVNLSNPLNTQVIQVQPIGDSGYVFTVDNAGNVAIGDAAHGGTLAVVGTVTFGSRVQGNGASNLRLDTGGVGRAIELDASGIQKFFVDSNGSHLNAPLNNDTGSSNVATLTGGHDTSGGLYQHDSTFSGDSNQTTLFLDAYQPASGAQVELRTKGVARFGATDNGAYLGSGSLSFLTGSISRIAFGFVGTGTGGTVVTHNFGVVPQVFFGNSAGNANVWFGSWTTTTVTVYASVSINVWWCCMYA